MYMYTYMYELAYAYPLIFVCTLSLSLCTIKFVVECRAVAEQRASPWVRSLPCLLTFEQSMEQTVSRCTQQSCKFNCWVGGSDARVVHVLNTPEWASRIYRISLLSTRYGHKLLESWLAEREVWVWRSSSEVWPPITTLGMIHTVWITSAITWTDSASFQTTHRYVRLRHRKQLHHVATSLVTNS